MHRFFVSPSRIQQGKVSFPPDQSHQIARVLRLRPGQQVIVLDNRGAAYEVVLERVSVVAVTGAVGAVSEAEGEPRVRLALFQGLLKGQKWEYLLQKGTELGISSFVPTICQRSVPTAGAGREGRMRRWEAILREAAEQSGRARIPELALPVAWEAACRQADGLALLAYEGELAASLRELLAGQGSASTISLFIGPEGGITEEEVSLARAQGIRPVTLGRRILRAETAGLVAAAAIFYALGELG